MNGNAARDYERFSLSNTGALRPVRIDPAAIAPKRTGPRYHGPYIEHAGCWAVRDHDGHLWIAVPVGEVER